jgi:hypothetical protein
MGGEPVGTSRAGPAKTSSEESVRTSRDAPADTPSEEPAAKMSRANPAETRGCHAAAKELREAAGVEGCGGPDAAELNAHPVAT